MSAEEITADPVAQLPANPVNLIVEAIAVPEIVETINDVEIATMVGTAEELSAAHRDGTTRADEHFSNEVASISQADQSFAGASNADSEAAYVAKASVGDTHLARADSYNVMGHGAAATAMEAGAKSSALERIATVQIAMQDVATRMETAVREVADRTQAGVEQEMRVTAAVADDAATSAQDLEGELKATAENTMALKA